MEKSLSYGGGPARTCPGPANGPHVAVRSIGLVQLNDLEQLLRAFVLHTAVLQLHLVEIQLDLLLGIRLAPAELGRPSRVINVARNLERRMRTTRFTSLNQKAHKKR